MNIYQEAKQLGIPMDSHESDMYLKDSPETRNLLRVANHSCSLFVSQIDGLLWWDVPFAFSPWWEARRAKA